jgi:hypothetical protein
VIEEKIPFPAPSAASVLIPAVKVNCKELDQSIAINDEAFHRWRSPCAWR